MFIRRSTRTERKNSKATLWGRLKQHQGNIQASGGSHDGSENGGGNHRGSVFRKHIGAALIQRDQITTEGAQSWGEGYSASREVRAKEHSIEQAVSRYIRQMPFLWLEIDDVPGPDSMRGYVERNAIALLSNVSRNPHAIDPPSADWLGNWSVSEQIRMSGLWNVNHVADDYDGEFLDFLAGKI